MKLIKLLQEIKLIPKKISLTVQNSGEYKYLGGNDKIDEFFNPGGHAYLFNYDKNYLSFLPSEDADKFYLFPEKYFKYINSIPDYINFNNDLHMKYSMLPTEIINEIKLIPKRLEAIRRPIMTNQIDIPDLKKYGVLFGTIADSGELSNYVKLFTDPRKNTSNRLKPYLDLNGIRYEEDIYGIKIPLIYFNISDFREINEIYQEESTSTVEHDGKIYSVNKLLKLIQLLKVIKEYTVYKTPVDKLKWILPPEIDDPKRVGQSDYNIPIVVTKWNGKLVVLDGLHRLEKTIEDGNQFIKVVLVGKNILDKCIV